MSDWANKFRLDIDSNKIEEDIIDLPVPIKLGSSVGINQSDMTRVFDLLDNGGNDDYTKLLIQSPGKQGSHAFFDESKSKNSISTFGDTKTIRYPLDDSQGVIYFPGSSSYLSAAASTNYLLGSTWTIDMWVFPTTFKASYNTLFTWSNGSNAWFQFWLDGSGQVKLGTNIEGEQTWTGSGCPLNTWTHLAFVSNNGSITVYKNGVSFGSKTGTYPTTGTYPVTIGWDLVSSREYTGYITECRISKGITRWTSDFVPPNYQYSTDANTVLLLHGNECNNSGVIRDSSTTPKVIQPMGGVKVVRETGKINERPLIDCDGAIYFDGTSDYLTIPASNSWHFVDTDYTIEFWSYQLSISPNKTFFSMDTGAGAWQGHTTVYCYSDGKLAIGKPGINELATAAGFIQINTWQHIAITKSGNTTTFFVNGIQVGQGTTDVWTNSPNFLTIGGYYGNIANINGYISNFRVSRGIVRYSSNFIPASVKLTSDSYTVLLIDSDFNNTNLITDSSSLNKTITKAGDTALKYLPKMDGDSSSIYFDGTGDYLTVPPSSDFDFENSDFTIDFYMNMSANNAYPHLITRWPNISNNFDFNIRLEQQSGSIYKITFLYTLTGDGAAPLFIYSNNVTISLDTWYHIAYVRSNNVLNIYLNGMCVGSSALTTAIPYHANAINIGRSESSPSQYLFTGKISNVRISKGIARWITDFTVSTETEATSNTKLLISPSSIMSNEVLNTLPPKAMTFDGNDCLIIPNSSDFNFGSNDFTLEMWINCPSPTSGSDKEVLTKATSSAYGPFCIYLSTTGLYSFYASSTGSSWDICATSPIGTCVANKWQHLAVCRKGKFIYYFLDGIRSTTTVQTTASLVVNSENLLVGAVNYTNPYYFTGQISNLRISKGIARYEFNFTPPTTFESDEYTKLLLFPSSIVSDESLDYDSIYPKKSVYFDGNGDYLLINPSPDWNFASSTNYTVECWFYKTIAGSTSNMIFSIDEGSGSSWQNLTCFYVYPTGSIGAGRSGLNEFVSATGVVSLNTWYHVALVKQGSTSTIYLNGVQVAQSTLDFWRDSTNPVCIGAHHNSTVYNWNGHITGIRFSKDIARYTANFVPPTSYTYDLYTKFVMQPEVIMTDESVNESNNWPDKSVTFDGTGDYLTIPSSSDFNVSNNNFTIECWLKINSLPANNCYFLYRGREHLYSNLPWSWWFVLRSTGIIRFNVANGENSYSSGDSSVLGTGIWYHLAVVRNGSTLSIYVNGILLNSSTTIGTLASNDVNNIYIGGYITSTYSYLNGAIANVRISKGIARYTSNFTPPTSEFVLDEYTKFLLKPSTIVSDESVTEDNVFPSKAVAFNGSNYLSLTGNSDTVFGTSDFTIEFWHKLNSIPNQGTFLDFRASVSATPFTVNVFNSTGSGGNVNCYSIYNGITHYATSGFIPNTSWTHIAIVRNNSTTYIYLNGSCYKIFSDTTNYNTGNNSIQIGRGLDSGMNITGSMYNLRISKGIARYTGNFTPQKTQFTTDSYTKFLLTPDSMLADESVDTSLVFPKKAMFFDGTGDYLTINNHEDFNFVGDFALDFWMNSQDTSTTKVLFTKRTTAGYTGLNVQQESGGLIKIYSSSNGTSFDMMNAITLGTITTNTWNHVCLSRNGNIFYMFLNGILTGTISSSSIIWENYSNLMIGGLTDGYSFKGFLSEFRFRKGIAVTSNFNTQTSEYSSDSYTKLLIHGDILTDSSETTPKVITKSGDTYGKVLYPPNDKGIYFDGDSDYLSISAHSDFVLSTSDFTIDFWFKSSSNSSTRDILLKYGTPNADIEITLGSSTATDWSSAGNIVGVHLYYNGSSWGLQFAGTRSVCDNIWHHIALTRTSSTFKLYIDGIQDGTGIYSYTFANSGPIEVASQSIANDRATVGLITNLCLSKTLRWNTTFNPPTDLYELDASTKLLIQPTSNIIHDEASHPVTVNGNCNVNSVYTIKPTSQTSNVSISNYLNQPSTEKSIYFDGSDYLELSDNIDFNFGSLDFTVDCWFKRTSSGTIEYIIAKDAPDTNWGNVSWRIYINSTNRVEFSTAVGSTAYEILNGTTFITDNAWHHVALVRSGSILYGFVDGILVGTNTTLSTQAINTTTQPVKIGRSNYSTPMYLTGHISNVRVSKGIARWTSNFDPSIIDYTTDFNDKLLIEPQTFYITDTSKSNNPSPWPLKAMSFNGTSSYVKVPDTSDFNFGSGDFTIETWIYSNLSTTFNIGCATGGYGAWNSTNGHLWNWFIHTDNKMYFQCWNGSALVAIVSTNTLNLQYGWHHVAIAKNSSGTYFYVDGQLFYVGTTLTMSAPSGYNQLLIGAGIIGGTSNIGLFFNGYLSDFRISKGVAKYLSTFTPPLSSLTKDTVPTVGVSENYISFDGTGDYIEVTSGLSDFAFGTNNFTVDYWINADAGRGDYDGMVVTFLNSGMTDTELWTDGGYNPTDYAYGIGYTANRVYNQGVVPRNAGIWEHHALVRNGSVTTFYVNGISKFTFNMGTISIDTPGKVFIGRRGNESYYFKGKLSNIRISNEALWISSFNPPTEVTATSSTKLLILPSTTISDSSLVPKTLTVSGDTKVVNAGQTTSTKLLMHPDTLVSDETFNSNTIFPKNVITFDGTLDHLSVPNTGDFNFATGGDVTIDCWFNINGGTNSQLFSTDAGVGSWQGHTGAYIYGDGKIAIGRFGVNEAVSAVGTVKFNVLNHAAFIKSGSTTYVYVNGIQVISSATSFWTDSGNPLTIGGSSNITTYQFLGNISNFRVSRGIVRWSSSFIPPTIYTVDSYTKLLIVPSSSGIIDETGKTVTVVGDCKSQYLWPTNDKSIYFDGIGDYLSVPDNVDTIFGNGDFTIELFANFSALTGSSQFLVGKVYNGTITDGNNWSFGCQLHSDNRILGFFYYGTNSTAIYSTSYIIPNKWYHIAFTRTSGNINLFLDGKLESTGSISTNSLNNPSSALLFVGAINDTVKRYLQGSVSNFRISKGIARWNASFNPLTIDYTTPDSYTKLFIKPDSSIIHDETGKTVTVNGNCNVNNSYTFHPQAKYDVAITDTLPRGEKVITINGNCNVNSSYTVHPVSKAGDVSIGNMYYPSNDKAIYFDGASDYLSLTNSQDWNFGNSDFTVEFWMKATNTTRMYALSMGVTNTTNLDFDFNDSYGLWVYWNSGGGDSAKRIQLGNVGQYCDNTWRHFALVNNATVFSLYINGIKVSSIAGTSLDLSGGSFIIGGFTGNPATYNLNGCISNLRISKGIARYVSNFDPSAIDYTVDEYTKLYINPSSTSIIDSTTSKTITVNGNCNVNSIYTRHPVSKAGDTKVIDIYQSGNIPEKAIYFDGNTDYLTLADSDDWNFGSSDFTIDLWANFYDTSSIKVLLGQFLYPQMSFQLYYNASDGIHFAYTTNGSSSNDTTFSYIVLSNVWYHFAVVRSSSTVTLFLNGNSLGTINIGTATIFNSTDVLSIGRTNNAPYYFFNGAISNIRVTKGSALWTSNFTPPSTITPDANTKLAIIPSGFTITDSATTPKTITVVGNCTVNNTYTFHPVAVAGDTKPVDIYPTHSEVTKCVYFDGNGDYLSLADSEDFTLTGDFTIDFWVNLDSSVGNHTIVSKWAPSGGGSKEEYLLAFVGADLYFYWAPYSIGPQFLTISNVINLGVWTHYALTRSGNIFTIFKNGVAITTGTNAGSVVNKSASLGIGVYLTLGDSGPTDYFYGKLSNFRISKGIARWSSNFDPSTVTYTVDSYTKLLIYPTTDKILDSATGKAVTVNGNCNVNYIKSKNIVSRMGDVKIVNPNFPLYPINFDGLGDYLTVSNITDFNFGSSNFTIEFWMKVNTLTAGPIIGCNWNVPRSWLCYLYADGKIEFDYSVDGTNWSTGAISAVGAIKAGIWQHVAYVRNGSVFTIYVNGISVVSITNNITIANSTSVLGIGGNWEGATYYYYTGSLANLRISKNIARYTSNFIPSTSNFTTDEYTKLLLQSDTLIDTSGTSKQVIRYGNTAVVVNPTKSIYFNGTTDYLQTTDRISDFNFRNNDFTIDGWLYFTGSAGVIYVLVGTNGGVGDWNTTNGLAWSLYINTDNKLYFSYNSNGTGASIVSINTIVSQLLNTWNHLAVVANSSGITFYINGSVFYTVSTVVNITFPTACNKMQIGCGGLYNSFWKGNIYNLRVTNGKALWTSTFIPPLSVTESINDSSCKLLLIDDVVDNSSTGRNISKYGTVTTVKNRIPEIEEAMYFDGTGDYLTIPHSSDFELGNSDFTIEFWFNIFAASPSDYHVVFNKRSSSSVYGGLVITLQDSTKTIIVVATSNNSSWDIALNKVMSSGWTYNSWNHFALVRNSGNWYGFTNGRLTGSFYNSSSIAANTYDVHIGGETNTTYLNGVLANLSISKEAKYTSNFNPPTLSYGSFTNRKKIAIETTKPQPDSYTKLLVAPSDIVKDLSDSNNLIVSNYVGNSIYFDGSGDYITVPSSSDWDFGNSDFTIDFWINCPSPTSGSDKEILTKAVYSTAYGPWCIYLPTSGIYQFYASSNGSSWDIASNSAIGTCVANTWQHIAICRKGTSIYYFLNGVKSGTVVTTSASFCVNTENLMIGAVNYSSQYPFVGSMAKFRISKGIARWENSFNLKDLDYTTPDSYTKLLLDVE